MAAMKTRKLFGQPVRQTELDMLRALRRSTAQVGLVILDQDYHLLWMNDLHRRELKAWTGHDFQTIKGKHCHQIWNNFEQTCVWCPVKETLRDGNLHLERAASPDKEHAPSLKYSHIVSIPLTPHDAAKKLVLEVIFFDQGVVTRQYDNLRRLLDTADQLGELLPYVANTDLFIDLVTFGLLTVITEHVTDIDSYCLESQPANSQPTVKRRRHMARADTAGIGPDFLKTLATSPDSIDAAWGAITARGAEVADSPSTLVGQIAPTYSALSDWLPQRLDANTITIRLPSTLEAPTVRRSWLLFLRNSESNSFLLRDDITQATLFMSSLRRHVDLLTTLRQQRLVQASLQKRLEDINHPHFMDAVPFALGKGHDLGHLISIQQDAVSTLRHLSLPSGVSQLIAPQLEQLDGVSAALRNLKSTLGSLKDLQSSHIHAVSIRRLLDTTLTYALQVLKTTGVQLAKQYSTGEDLNVRADDALLEQVLFNLLDNSAKALRFVTHRIPTITVTTRKLNDELVELVVHDNGLGITPDDLPHVFNRYFTTYAKGTGLGLYYARVIVEDIHKGKIVIESKWGSSTTVRVHLPWCP